MGWNRVALVMMLVGACGDDSSSAVADAAVDSSGSVDTADSMMLVPCDFTEGEDATNDRKSTAEATNLTLGATKLTLCGKVDTGHFNSGATDLVDADAFAFTLTNDADVIVHITGSGLGGPDDSVLQFLSKLDNGLYGFGVVEGDNAAMVHHLTAGEWVIATATFNSAATASAIDYRLTLALDAPNTRCPANTDNPVYTEGTDNGTNDVAESAFTSSPEVTLTSSTTDAPAVTSIEVAAGTSYLITGSLASVDPADDYMDRDTFAFTTGPTTTQMSVRLNWASTTADLDYRIFTTVTSDPPSIASGLNEAASEDEFDTFAVKPNTTYWLWTAAEDGSSAPATYAATLCGETFTP